MREKKARLGTYRGKRRSRAEKVVPQWQQQNAGNVLGASASTEPRSSIGASNALAKVFARWSSQCGQARAVATLSPKRPDRDHHLHRVALSTSPLDQTCRAMVVRAAKTRRLPSNREPGCKSRAAWGDDELPLLGARLALAALMLQDINAVDNPAFDMTARNSQIQLARGMPSARIWSSRPRSGAPRTARSLIATTGHLLRVYASGAVREAQTLFVVAAGA